MTFSLTCTASDLARAVSLATQVSGNAKQISILKSCMIAVADGYAVIAATDMDHSVRVTLTGEGSGTVFIDTGMLAQKSAALRPNQPVTISGEDPKFVMMVQGKTKWKIPLVLGGEAYPHDITQPIAGDTVTASAAEFIGAMNAAGSVVRPIGGSVVNMGVYLDTEDGFRAVGGDTRGLAVIQIASAPLPISIIVPSQSISSIGNIFRNADKIDIVATENGMTISADGVMYRTKLIEQNYVNWRGALKAQTASVSGSVLVDVAHITEGLKRATAIAEDRSKSGTGTAVILEFTDGECCATAKNRTGEEGVDYFQCDGDNGRCIVDAGFLMDVIGSFTSERLKIGFNPDAEGAITVEPYPAAAGDNMRVVMPRRV